MPVYRAFLRTMGALAFVALALACGGHKNAPATPGISTAKVSGTVTYARVPLVKDASGLPTGLADETTPANLVTLPARGAVLRVYQQVEQTQPDGSKTYVWILQGTSSTDLTGGYSIIVTIGRPTLVELLSSFDGGNGSHVHLIAEPNGIGSLDPSGVLDRRFYVLRKAADGQSPLGLNTPSSTLTGDATVNFSVGLKDAWWIADTDYLLASGEAPFLTQAVLETDLPGRSIGEGTGSRVLGIGDTLASHVAVYGSGTTGNTLDLHYWPGRSEPRGTYVEYDLSAPLYAPRQNFDPSNNQFHLFGSIRGDAANDDAWDEGVLLPLFARNTLFAGNPNYPYSFPLNPLPPIAALLTGLSPDIACIEGLADAMAAAILKSPYLADTHGTSLAAPIKDIRDQGVAPVPGLSAYSAPAIRALGWEITLKANSITSPGTPTDWAKIDPLASQRFFVTPTGFTHADGTVDLEPLNIYAHIKALQRGKAVTEPIDLAAIFTDAALTPLVAPFGFNWPRPTTGPESLFRVDWGTDPNSAMNALSPIPFSMASAVQVNGVFPNVSKGEVIYSGFYLSADKRYILSTVITPALGAGAAIDLDLPRINRTFPFSGAGGSTEPVIIPVNGTAPYFHPVRIRLKSPDSVQPDFTVTVVFTPAP